MHSPRSATYRRRRTPAKAREVVPRRRRRADSPRSDDSRHRDVSTSGAVFSWGMGELLLASVAWLAATAIALGALVTNHDETAAISLAAAAAVTLFTRSQLSRAKSADRHP